MANQKRSVLITGCTDPAGMGAALAIAFQNAGLHVYATGRGVDRMSNLKDRGIDTLDLDVTDAASISSCVSQVPSLDILVNNAGRNLPMPVVDLDIAAAKEIFELNTWAPLAVSQAFLPLLLKSDNPIIATNTSIANSSSVPFQGVYGASKAASAKFLDIMRAELEPWNVKVVELRTGLVLTGMLNKVQVTKPQLPSGSIYEPVADLVQHDLEMRAIDNVGIAAKDWAEGVVSDVLRKNPPYVVWRGTQATVSYWVSWFPLSVQYWLVRQISVMGKVAQRMKELRTKKTT